MVGVPASTRWPNRCAKVFELLYIAAQMKTIVQESLNALQTELTRFLEFKIEIAQSNISMYQKDSGKLWPNYEELIWSQRCIISAHDLTLSKIKRIKDAPTKQ